MLPYLDARHVLILELVWNVLLISFLIRPMFVNRVRRG
jgi:hypothetical protein